MVIPGCKNGTAAGVPRAICVDYSALAFHLFLRIRAAHNERRCLMVVSDPLDRAALLGDSRPAETLPRLPAAFGNANPDWRARARPA